MPKTKTKKSANAKAQKQRASTETQAKQFGEEVETLGKKIGAHGKEFGENSDKTLCECRGRYYGAFGAAGLILSIIIGILGLAVSIWALDFLAKKTSSVVLFGVHDFLLTNIGILILISIVSSIFTYCRRCCPRQYLLFSPVSSAFGLTIVLWVVTSVATIANMDFGNADLFNMLWFVKTNLLGIFWFFLILGYFFLLIRLLLGRVTEDTCCKDVPKRPQTIAPSGKPDGIKRLYRSGNDKILGGVCGGIAEYLGVDPVLIRLIWAVAVFFYGTGVLLYIICWIIIPRNPAHEWSS